MGADGEGSPFGSAGRQEQHGGCVMGQKYLPNKNSLEQAGHVTIDRHLIVYIEVNIKFIVCMCNLIVLQHNLLHLKA